MIVVTGESSWRVPVYDKLMPKPIGQRIQEITAGIDYSMANTDKQLHTS